MYIELILFIHKIRIIKKRNLTVSKLLIPSKLYIEYFDFLSIARKIFVLYSDK